MATLKTLVIFFAIMVVALAAVPRPKPEIEKDVEQIPANSEVEPNEVLKGESSYGFGYGGYGGYGRYYGGYGGWGGYGYGYPYYGSYYGGFGYPYYGGYGGYGGLYGGHWW